MSTATLVAPPARKLTPDDLLALPGQGKGFEHVNGELKELNVAIHMAKSKGNAVAPGIQPTGR